MKSLKILSIPKFGRRAENSEDSLDAGKKGDPESKPRKPRKRKDPPPKPWGKIERIIVLIIFISVPALSLLFLIRSKNSQLASPISIPAPAIVKDIIPSTPKDTTDLKKDIELILKNSKGTYGVWLESLDGNYSLGINENQKFEGASLFKLPLMIAYYKALDSGEIKSNTTYSLKHSDAQAGAGTLASLPAGTAITYRDLVEAMGKNSDNTAYGILERIIGVNKEVETIKSLGMMSTDLSKSTTTPHDIGLLFSKLNSENIISSSSKKELLSFLTDTEFENLIPEGVPDNITVAHKYGSVSGEINDAGIVMANRPFILIILSNGAGLQEAEEKFPEITKIIYDWTIK